MNTEHCPYKSTRSTVLKPVRNQYISGPLLKVGIVESRILVSIPIFAGLRRFSYSVIDLHVVSTCRRWENQANYHAIRAWSLKPTCCYSKARPASSMPERNEHNLYNLCNARTVPLERSEITEGECVRLCPALRKQRPQLGDPSVSPSYLKTLGQ